MVLQKYRLIDTAGIRKRAAVASAGSTTEVLSVNRALRAICRSDVVALVIEAMACITEQVFLFNSMLFVTWLSCEFHGWISFIQINFIGLKAVCMCPCKSLQFKKYFSYYQGEVILEVGNMISGHFFMETEWCALCFTLVYLIKKM